PAKPATDGCDPAEFATQITSYLEAAAEQRAAAQFIEPPLPVPAAAPPLAAATTAQQRYVPLEPGRLYRDEGTTSHEFAALPAVEAISEPAATWTEAEPVAEPAEPLVAFDAAQLPAYDTSDVETIPEPVETLPEPMSETVDPMLETAEPLYATPETTFETPEPVYEPLTPTYEAPEPILEAQEPVLEAPEPIYEASEPIYEAPTSTYEAPEPILEAPVPVLETPEPIFEASEPIYAAPEPIFETPEPIYEASASIYEAPEATLEAEAPVLETPEPIFEAAEPTFGAPEPILETSAPVLETAEPNAETPEPVFETPWPPEPLAPRGPAFSRRIGFVVRDEEPELTPLAADSLDIEFEPIELAAVDTDFVFDGLSEPVTRFSASVDDEAIELVDVDLSTALSEFDEPHVIEAQSDADVVELFETETPALVEAKAAGTSPIRAIEFDALKEFAAAIEAMTASEQNVSVAHHSGADDKPFEFDDLFPRREPVEPSPLSAWHSWMPLEGIAAEVLETPVPAPAVERSAEKQQAPERPDWVQLVESLRIDVERRRSEQPSAAPARKPSARPIQDEWGLFDPAQCGFAALLDKLEEITETSSPSRPRRSA
ncbi:MAG TPA: hypothetical protein VKB36_00620, partial [Vicinamibacterales bacterium]|nr:hypothetical protein [Vicinamibacterales bacterium]